MFLFPSLPLVSIYASSETYQQIAVVKIFGVTMNPGLHELPNIWSRQHGLAPFARGILEYDIGHRVLLDTPAWKPPTKNENIKQLE